MNTNTDLTEEDAADLQFPKDDFLSHIVETKCANCENELSDTFILCAECDVSLCTSCFANGVELGPHTNDHSYKVLRNNFILFNKSDWTAKEELILLNGILTLSNFHKIAKLLPTRTLEEIKEHYNTFYLNRKGSNSLPQIENNNKLLESIVPYRFRLNNIPDPIRNTENAPGGYNAARSDFEYDYDKNAEDIICNLEHLKPNEPYYKILTDLQFAIGNSYKRRVWERLRRKRIIREHGLIMQQKTTSWLHRYDMTLTPQIYEKMVRFMQFYTGQGFEYVMEGLHRAGELQVQISRLCEFRQKGIKSLDEAQLYLKLKKQREDGIREIKRFQNIADLNIKYKNVSIPISLGASKRRSMAPLEIIGLPGYEKLLASERDLCRNIRLAPLNYLDLKAVLIAENNKMGCLKLLTARRLLKIDVNKTRKMYDFLLKEGFVKKAKD